MSLELQLLLLAWGTLVGLDLVSVPQAMIARPLVAGPIAGAMLGDVATGLQLGALFDVEDLGPQSLAGFGERQGAWRVISESGVVSRFEALRDMLRAV